MVKHCVMKDEIFLIVGTYSATNREFIVTVICVCIQPTNLLVVFTKDLTVVGVALIARIFIWYYYIHSQFVAALA